MIAKIKRGSGFRGALNYGFNEGENAIEGKEALLIGGNMTGTTAKELAAEFKQCRKLMPEVSRPVWTESLRPEGTVDLTPEQWNELATGHMKAIGLDPDKHMHSIFQHPQENHIHIVASRISIDGDLYLGRNEHLIASRDCRRIEKEYGLQQLPAKPTPTKGVKHLTKNEIEMQKRTGEPPPRAKLQGIISKSLAGRPTLALFEKRLVDAGVSFKKSTGGYSYEIDGVAFKGSQLGAKYSFSRLKNSFSTQEQQAARAERQALFAARSAAWQTEQERRSQYRSNRYTIRSTGRIVSSILPKPLGLSIELAAELVAVVAAVNDWTQAQAYKRHVKDLTDKLNQAKVKPQDVVIPSVPSKSEPTPVRKTESPKIQEVKPTPEKSQVEDPRAALGNVTTTISSEPVSPPKPFVAEPQSEALPPVKETNQPPPQPAVDVKPVDWYLKCLELIRELVYQWRTAVRFEKENEERELEAKIEVALKQSGHQRIHFEEDGPIFLDDTKPIVDLIGGEKKRLGFDQPAKNKGLSRS